MSISSSEKAYLFLAEIPGGMRTVTSGNKNNGLSHHLRHTHPGSTAQYPWKGEGAQGGKTHTLQTAPGQGCEQNCTSVEDVQPLRASTLRRELNSASSQRRK